MRVFKFGGASVKDAAAVKNVAAILADYPEQDLVVILSAMGKTTNAMELLTRLYFRGEPGLSDQFQSIKAFHQQIVESLFPGQALPEFFTQLFDTLWRNLQIPPGAHYDFEYDRLVPFGELLSTHIVSDYLNQKGLLNRWHDARSMVITDSHFREAHVDWEQTREKIQTALQPQFATGKHRIALSQGFIGGTIAGQSTTLGREGSDYSAAIFAWVFNADEVIIWKDVPGLLNADPKYFPNTRLLEQISYQEAIELAYYGATIIHPKTIKPLQNKRIPLRIRSFVEPAAPGSLIQANASHDPAIPSYIFKQNQVLLSLYPRDFSFIAELHLHEIYGHFAEHRIKVNLIQNSAISFSVCMDKHTEKLNKLMAILQKEYKLRYNDHVELITIRHYDQATIDRVVNQREVLVEQRSRVTAQLVVRHPVSN